jgi:hypothetical protein
VDAVGDGILDRMARPNAQALQVFVAALVLLLVALVGAIGFVKDGPPTCPLGAGCRDRPTTASVWISTMETITRFDISAKPDS